PLSLRPADRRPPGLVGSSLGIGFTVHPIDRVRVAGRWRFHGKTERESGDRPAPLVLLVGGHNVGVLVDLLDGSVEYPPLKISHARVFTFLHAEALAELGQIDHW